MITKIKLSKITAAVIVAIAAMTAIVWIGQQQTALAQELDELQLLEQIGDEIEGADIECLVGSPIGPQLCPEDIRDFYDAALCSRAATDSRYERFC